MFIYMKYDHHSLLVAIEKNVREITRILCNPRMNLKVLKQTYAPFMKNEVSILLHKYGVAWNCELYAIYEDLIPWKLKYQICCSVNDGLSTVNVRCF